MANAWISHIRHFAKTHGVTYACALSDPRCKSSYKAPAKKVRGKKAKVVPRATPTFSVVP